MTQSLLPTGKRPAMNGTHGALAGAQAGSDKRADLRGKTFAEGEAALAPNGLEALVARGTLAVDDVNKPITGLLVDCDGLIDFRLDHILPGSVDLASYQRDRATGKLVLDSVETIDKACAPGELGDNVARISAKATEDRNGVLVVHFLASQLAAIRVADLHLGSRFLDAGKVALDFGAE